jgi:hypothetical protein
VGQYIKFVTTIVDSAKRGQQFEKELKTVLGLDARPGLVVPPVPTANPGTVGAAFDYRVRYELGPCQSYQFVADLRRYGLVPDIEPLINDFFFRLDAFAERTQPWRGQLDREDDRVLARYCVVLAMLESVRRVGQVRFDLAPARAQHSLLGLASEPAAEDVMNLHRSSATTLRGLPRASQAYIPNPTFAGSSDVGGADADFILGDCLWEVKTTKNLNATALRDCFLQLVGYSLLDYDDRYGIRRVGGYFARHDYLWAPPLWALVFPPVQVLKFLQQHTTPDETEIVERLARLRGLIRRISSGDAMTTRSSSAVSLRCPPAGRSNAGRARSRSGERYLCGP